MVQARDLDAHAKKQNDPQYAQGATVMQNCAIESFLLHYRALREFFGNSSKNKPDDIRASDYLDTWQSTATWLNDEHERDKINKRLAHLSTLRTTLDNEWDFPHMQWNVSQTFEDFISALAPDQQVWFSKVTTVLSQRRPTTIELGSTSSTVSMTGPFILFPDFK